MAIDTSRGRLERLARRSRRRVGWATTTPGTIARVRRGAPARAWTGWVGSAALVVAGLVAYQLGPSGIRARVDEGLQQVALLSGSGCAELPVSYGRAVRTLGTPHASSYKKAFDRALLACERDSDGLASASRAGACRTSASLYAGAYDRRAAIASVVAARPVEAGGVIGASAAGIFGGDDLDQTEALAERALRDCGSS